MDLERLIMKNKEVQAALLPVQEAWKGLGDQLATSLIPVIKELTPALISLAGSLSQIITWFSSLPVGVQESIVGFVALLAVIGPVLVTVGQIITALGALGTAWTTVSGIIAPIASGVIPAMGGALAAITAPVWLLIGAIALLGVTIAVFGKDAWNTILTIGKTFEALWLLIKIKVDQIKQAFFSVDWGGIGKNIISGVINGIRSISIVGAISSAVNVLKRANGGFASGLTLVGERGPEIVNLPRGSYVNSNSASQQMSGGKNITLNYSPMISLADEFELQTKLGPIIRNAMRGAV
jgi:hypothetical protein